MARFVWDRNRKKTVPEGEKIVFVPEGDEVSTPAEREVVRKGRPPKDAVENGDSDGDET